jgi:hypothetical protein
MNKKTNLILIQTLPYVIVVELKRTLSNFLMLVVVVVLETSILCFNLPYYD